MDIVHVATCELANVLHRVLSPLDECFWDKFVVSKLTLYQREMILGKGDPGLGDLDLASLLTVLDANLERISEQSARSREIRNYLMELKTIRNQISHKSSKPIPVELILCQWQTLKLLLVRIGGSEQVLGLVNSYLVKILRNY
jgi:hypothetical protein